MAKASNERGWWLKKFTSPLRNILKNLCTGPCTFLSLLSLSLPHFFFYFSSLLVRCVGVRAQASPAYNPLPWRPCFNFKQRVGNSRIAALKSLNRKTSLCFSPTSRSLLLLLWFLPSLRCFPFLWPLSLSHVDAVAPGRSWKFTVPVSKRENSRKATVD